MKKLLVLEEIAQLFVAGYCFHLLQIPWHWATVVLLFFSPDLGAIGYLINTSAGATMYNFTHHKMVAILLFALGNFYNLQGCMAIGLLFFAHSCFDRILGYGLKYMDSSSHTHLGYIGKEKYKNQEISSR